MARVISQNEPSFLFTSESVGEGHPDKICDQISDAILDEYLKIDPNCKVACEVFAITGSIVVGGEISSSASIDITKVVRSTLQSIGYDGTNKGLDYNNCGVLIGIVKQSEEIAAGVHLGREEEDLGAGDQGIMFGYATDETEEAMPLTVTLAHELNRKLGECRRSDMKWLRPDSKSQITIEYEDNKGACIPKKVHTVVVSVQHDEKISLEELRKEVEEKVIRVVIPKNLMSTDTIIHINPAGSFTVGGPQGDAGLTGRKIIVDTYGGWGAHGGGAFSGKDSTKVDRSAAYAARWVAKSLVKAGLCRRVLVQLSYAIGISEPLAIFINDYGTGVKSISQLLKIVKDNFDLRPGIIVRDLELKKPIYLKTAVYGHFGRKDFSWEKPKSLKF
uniref:S-adenosylmethionine synthase n=1 Tax=Lepeophtheirus salmonis TaxID=72036 RepID=D3PH81_LEPSM|nr:S-adenosylmethionine synthetase isoform type-2 [Lepeophtheirus salmonis]